MLRRLLALFLLVAALAPAAAAQRLAPNDGLGQALGVGVFLIDFEFDGEGEPIFSFDYAAPAYGVIYTRQNLVATAAYGVQDADGDAPGVSLLDVSLSTWGALYPASLQGERTRVSVPIILLSNYRRVAPRDSDDFTDAFSVTVLGLGVGLGLEQRLAPRLRLDARANPVLGLATSALTDALGSAQLLEADLQFHLADAFGRLGLMLGYNGRLQIWNVNASDLFPDVTDDLFDYRGHQHLFRLGLSF